MSVNIRHWAERRCNFSEHELDTLTDAQMLDRVYEAQRAKLEAAEIALEAERSKLTCFRCRDGNTPLYCLNCAGEMLLKKGTINP